MRLYCPTRSPGYWIVLEGSYGKEKKIRSATKQAVFSTYGL